MEHLPKIELSTPEAEQPQTPPHEIPSPTISSAEMEKYIIEHGTESSVREAKERVFGILDIVREDENALMLIDAALNSVFRYVESIYNMEVSIQIAQYRLEGDAYREFVQNLDGRRTQAHSALISSVAACNRYLFQNFEGKVPEGGICSLDAAAVQANQRRAIGDWAVELEFEILTQRRG